MTQPSPDPPGASHGDYPLQPLHLSCRCQRERDEPLSLCGFPIDLERRFAVDDVPDDPAQCVVEVGCVVCLDLARAALVAGRCERCVP